MGLVDEEGEEEEEEEYGTVDALSWLICEDSTEGDRKSGKGREALGGGKRGGRRLCG